MAPLIEPETPRLLLRQWRHADLEPFAALNADPRVMAFFPAPLTRTESDALACRCRGLIDARGWGLWAVELKATGAFVGCVGLNIPAAALPCAPCVEIAWRLAPAHWGQGLATEAARAALEAGFARLGLAAIVAFTPSRNHPSRALMVRLGMRLAGTFLHPLLPVGSPLRRHVLYRLTA